MLEKRSHLELLATFSANSEIQIAETEKESIEFLREKSNWRVVQIFCFVLYSFCSAALVAEVILELIVGLLQLGDSPVYC